MSKVVVPGQSSLFCADCVDLSALPGIRVLAAPKQERRGWPGIGGRKRRRPSDGYGPAMTKMNLFQMVRNSTESARWATFQVRSVQVEGSRTWAQRVFSSSRARIRSCLVAAAVDGGVRTGPHAKCADKGIGIVAGPASFRQLMQVHEISAADDDILGFGGRD